MNLRKFLLASLVLISAINAIAQKPKATIITPIVGQTYKGNQEIAFKGVGTDDVDGDLSALAFRWQIFMNHGKGNAQHWHDGIALYDGIKEGVFSTPVSDDHVLGDSIYFRFILVVTNSAGESDTATVDVTPKQTQVTINTNPSGGNIFVQGYGELTTPINAAPTQDMLIILTAIESQTINGEDYNFSGWDNGIPQATIAVTVPDEKLTIIANYERVNAVDRKLDRKSLVTYPNPASDQLTVESFMSEVLDINLEIFDSQGKLILKNNQSSASKISKIDISGMQGGLYVVKIMTPKGYSYQSFVKQ